MTKIFEVEVVCRVEATDENAAKAILHGELEDQTALVFEIGEAGEVG